MQQIGTLIVSVAANLAGEEARVVPIALGILFVALSIALVRGLVLESAAILLLGSASHLVLVAPSSAPMIVLLGGALGSLLVALGGVLARRRRAATELQLIDIERRLIGMRTELECLLLRRSTATRQRRNGESGQGALTISSEGLVGATEKAIMSGG